MKLLTIQNAKTQKGEAKGYLTGILYLKPAKSSGITDVCPKSTKGCRDSCLNTAGRGRFSSVQNARQQKTEAYKETRHDFIEQLVSEARALAKKAKKMGLKPCIRINGTSDMPMLARTVAAQVPEVQFYDYTKIPQPEKRVLPNYSLTFSRSETNEKDCKAALAAGINVAVVFEGKPPEKYWGYDVINGDEDDLRFLDPSPVIVGLKAKGRAKHDQTGFTVRGGHNKPKQGVL